MTGPTESGVTPDTDAAEEFAEEVGVDPTQEDINRYQELEGADPAVTIPDDADTSSLS